MPRAEVGTPKYIANKIKAKGLQKLRWYCQMCQKQCRDENGFKCHLMSESHQRQLLLFADNPHKFLDEFSRRFEKDFLDLLKRQFGTKRVLANKVYQEYINDRQHTHMNATQWETLTEFVKWLGKENKCVVDETEKGWFITYRDVESIKQQEQIAKKKKMEKDDEEEMQEFIKRQVEYGKKNITPEINQPTELLKSGEEKISFKLASSNVKPKLVSNLKIFQDETKRNFFICKNKFFLVLKDHLIYLRKKCLALKISIRYNPENLATLERYVQVQSQENAYDLEANIAVLKLYQFNQQYNHDITTQILLKALTNLPHTDFALCKCLLNEQMCKESPIEQIVNLADLLESSDFQTFWNKIYSMPALYEKINGFQDSIRKFVCHVVGITFQTIHKYLLSELLGNIDDNALKMWVKKYGWKEIENNLIFISNQDENIKTKNITEEINFEKLVDILNKYRGFINKYEEIYFNYVYRRVSDCSHTPVSSSIKTNIVINNRVTDDYGWTFRKTHFSIISFYSDTNERKECINFGSFDYMGFNEIVQDQFSELSSIIEKYGITTCSSHLDCGITPLHIQLEKLTAEFVGMEDAISYCTGFSTNVSNLPVILSEECLVLSDEKNHASLISGMRMSKAKIIKYSHMGQKKNFY
ncbi:hypothetical protein PGB90_008457 [Kerria lacca]